MTVLYSFRRCPYAMRARMALAWSGVNVELREVRLRDKPASMLAVSPKATVPVLVSDKGDVLDESLDIMLWALLRHAPYTCALGGGVVDQRAEFGVVPILRVDQERPETVQERQNHSKNQERKATERVQLRCSRSDP